MMTLPWRRRSPVVLAFLACLQSVLVEGIAISACSTENTGSNSFPNNYNLQSLGYCRDQCGGYAFAITQGKACWCSDYAPSSTTSDSSCNQACPGFPYEFCGSSGGEYSYLQLGTPSGTGGPYSAPSSSVVMAPPVVYTPEPNTIFQTVENTVVSNSIVIRTTAVVQTRVITQEPVTQTKVSFVPVTQRQSVTLIPQASTRTSIKPVTSQQMVTISGAVETRYITSVPSETAATSGSTADFHQASSSGLSNGAVAGVTIGVIAAAALAALSLFCCWRRRRREKAAGGINRNTSVLSKAGLLRHTSDAGSPVRPASAYIPSSAPRLDTQIPSIGISGPPSAAASGMLERSDSRPLFRDQRLNPNALMLHNDTSRTSVGTLQDDKDYSRPLEVRNPDPSR